MSLNVEPSAFAGDDGSPDPALAAAIEAFATENDPATRRAEIDLVAALAQARVLVPVVALPAEGAADHGADMAVVTITAPDGRRALPVFSCMANLQRWDARARPVPVEAARAALSAVAQGCEVLIVDAAGPSLVVLPRPAVWALAQGRPWLPAAFDPEVHAAVTAVCRRVRSRVPQLSATRCEPGERAELRVVLAVRPGLDREGLDALIRLLEADLAGTDLLTERAESVELRIVPVVPDVMDEQVVR